MKSDDVITCLSDLTIVINPINLWLDQNNWLPGVHSASIQVFIKYVENVKFLLTQLEHRAL